MRHSCKIKFINDFVNGLSQKQAVEELLKVESQAYGRYDEYILENLFGDDYATNKEEEESIKYQLIDELEANYKEESERLFKLNEQLIKKVGLEKPHKEILRYKVELGVPIQFIEECNSHLIEYIKDYQKKHEDLIKYDKEFNGFVEPESYYSRRDNHHDLCPDPVVEDSIDTSYEVDRKNRNFARVLLLEGNIILGIDANGVKYRVLKEEELDKFRKFNTDKYKPWWNCSFVKKIEPLKKSLFKISMKISLIENYVNRHKV